MGRLKKETGIIFCLIFCIIFIFISNILSPCFDGSDWYIVSSIQRFLFFAVELFVFIKFFRRNIKEVIHLQNFKQGIIAGAAMFLYIPFYIITYHIIGAKEWCNTSISIVVSCLIFQQLTTGLWEELTFRAFVCEGYFQNRRSSFRSRIVYAIISFFIFGLGHAIECDFMAIAVYRFISTGIWGFAFASVYLYSRNVLVVAFIHFVTDIVFNASKFIEKYNDTVLLTVLDNYVQFIFLGIIVVASIICLHKEPLIPINTEKNQP